MRERAWDRKSKNVDIKAAAAASPPHPSHLELGTIEVIRTRIEYRTRDGDVVERAPRTSVFEGGEREGEVRTASLEVGEGTVDSVAVSVSVSVSMLGSVSSALLSFDDVDSGIDVDRSPESWVGGRVMI